ncbi:MAG: DUF2063 domain-containing protein [Alphaproteobacteria bacterium]|nr:DUF2063 domain-containing protein [Alphaproteobacteria bacterium]
MPSPSLQESGGGIADIQAAFADRILGRRRGVPGALDAASARRFDIHRNNVYASLVEALRTRFPVVERLVGPSFFPAMAASFIDDHPPRSPVLIEYGALMPTFIATFSPAADIPYLADVARLEWLRHAAYHAAEAEPLDPATLADLPESAVGGLRLALHLATRVFAS